MGTAVCVARATTRTFSGLAERRLLKLASSPIRFHIDLQSLHFSCTLGWCALGRGGAYHPILIRRVIV